MEIIIYTITSLYNPKPDVDGNKTPIKEIMPRKSRLVGMFKTLEKAKQCVDEDWANFDEAGYYNFIVIEGLLEGCYPGLGDNEWWYKHDREKNKWVPCEKPNSYKGLVNFYG